MRKLSITLPEPLATRAEEAFANQFEYSPAGGLTKSQFLLRRVRAYLLEVTGNYEVDQAGLTARRTKLAEVQGEFNSLPPEVE